VQQSFLLGKINNRLLREITSLSPKEQDEMWGVSPSAGSHQNNEHSPKMYMAGFKDRID
jgi:hypothetical protein